MKNTSFLSASEELGRDFTLIQGAGGNTSYKEENDLFIKASGYKLKDSLEKDIFVKVNLRKLKDSLEQNKTNPLEGTWEESLGKRPSMETSMHAILPQRYIFHLHCLNTLSWLVQNDFESHFSKIFKNLKYKVVQYKTPGIPLAKEIKKVIEEEKPEIIFLSNHGLVVGADDISKGLELTYYVSKKLEILTNNDKKVDLKKLNLIALNTCFRPTKYKDAHNIAFSKQKIRIASSGSLYPDHVVFLGPSTSVVEKNSELIKIIEETDLNQKLPIVIVPNGGILVPDNISFEAEELVLALTKIVEKIPNTKKIKYLNFEDENVLKNSNSEHYRLSLNSTK